MAKFSPKKFLRLAGVIACGFILLIPFAWACGALWFDGPCRTFAILNALAVSAACIFIKPWRYKLSVFAGWFAIVTGWWLTLDPTQDADWQTDVSQVALAEIDGDVVTLNHVRNFEYLSESDYTPRWETRSVRLSQLTGIDIAITYWGSPWIAHPIMSFQFADAPPVCFSIETRKKAGQSYSAIGGLYRQYELIFIVADERDVIGLRTNHRQGEDVYLYRTTLTPDQARKRFLDYLYSINALKQQPQWYHAITTNCTTTIRHQHDPDERVPWDWRLLLNGKGDEMLYELNRIETGGLSFTELKQKAHINPAARAAGNSPDFSASIRADRPGF